jgi:GNAT superfamily N-acetyltransferase
VIVRLVQEDEHAALGELTARAYREIGTMAVEPGYERELRDIAAKVAGGALVAVAVAGDRVVGGVTYVPDAASVFAEFDDPDAAGFRHLAVDPDTEGKGAGRALVAWCVDEARSAGKKRIIIHSTPWMTRAHELYVRNGFVRRTDLDWQPLPDVPLMGFVLEL